MSNTKISMGVKLSLDQMVNNWIKNNNEEGIKCFESLKNGTLTIEESEYIQEQLKIKYYENTRIR